MRIGVLAAYEPLEVGGGDDRHGWLPPAFPARREP
jgi:hypothetical protein